MASYDGTSKSMEGHAQDIRYFAASSPYMESVKQRCLSKASPKAISFLDPLNYSGPCAVDASGMSEFEWKKRRKSSVGSSSVAKIFGENPYPNGTNLDLYHEMVGTTPWIPENDEDWQKLKKNMRFLGLLPRLEAEDREQALMFAKGHFAEEYLHEYTRLLYPNSKLIIDTNIYNPPSRPYMTVNLDAMMQLSDGSYVHIEYKTANKNMKAQYENDSIPAHYKRQLIQCQHTMGVWVSYLIVLFNDLDESPIVRRYERDLDAEMEQVLGLDEFMTKHVYPKVPPNPAGPAEHILECLRKYSGAANNSAPEKMLSPDLLSYVHKALEIEEKLKLANAQVKFLTEEKKRALIPLVLAMGQDTLGCIREGATTYEIKYAPQAGRKSVDYERLKLDYPEIYLQYVTQKEEGSRPMKIKEIRPKIGRGRK